MKTSVAVLKDITKENLSAFHMDNYTSDDDIDDDFDTQFIIQQSLQDNHKPGTTQQSLEDESFLSADYKKIIEAIETVRKMYCHT